MNAIHSIVNVITNSSTEIYTYVDDNADKAAKEMIDRLFRMMGVTDRAEDHFNISIGTDPKYSDTKVLKVTSRLTGEEINLITCLKSMINQHAEYNG